MKYIRKELRKCSDIDRAKNCQRFFKTGPDQYGEGDVFIGVTSPNARKIAKNFVSRVGFKDIELLIKSKIHEERLVGVLILVEMFKKNPESVYNFYLKNSKGVNNWDLVDLSAPKIVGAFLLDKSDKIILYKLASSENLWDKRISIVSTYTFIKENQFKDTLKISKMLLGDRHDLIHKAVGWMLREVGKRDIEVLKKFLRDNYNELPRTTLRYAIERFPEDLRKKYLLGKYERN
jgi:3-methyladenine DNA glycosylase AlkD